MYFFIVLYCTSIVLYCTVLYCIVSYCIVLYCIASYLLCCIILFKSIYIHCMVYYNMILYDIILRCIVVFYITLQFNQRTLHIGRSDFRFKVISFQRQEAAAVDEASLRRSFLGEPHEC